MQFKHLFLHKYTHHQRHKILAAKHSDAKEGKGEGREGKLAQRIIFFNCIGVEGKGGGGKKIGTLVAIWGRICQSCESSYISYKS
jgi:hypothetical protein